MRRNCAHVFFLPLVLAVLIIPAFTMSFAAADRENPAAKTSVQPLPSRNATIKKEAPRQKSGNSAEEDREEDSAMHMQDQAWQDMWSGQLKMINEMRETAISLSGSFSQQTQDLSRELAPFEEEARRLLVFANTFRGHPNAMEAVSRRMGATIAELDEVLNPVTMARSEAQGLLERINSMALSLPQDSEKSMLSEEMRGYMNIITRTRLRLTAVLAQYNSLLPSLKLVTRLEQTREDITRALPELWKEYYLQKPLAWLSPDRWINAGRDVYYSWQALLLRLPVEIPGNTTQWGTALIRFVIGLIFAGALSLILRSKMIQPGSPAALVHIFRIGIPWTVLGFAILGSALSASGDFFRFFLVIGSSCLIIGQVYMAWDLRRLQYPEQTRKNPPFLHMVPKAFLGYAMLYLPLTQPLMLVLWAAILIAFMLGRKNSRKIPAGLPSFETGALECKPIINWLCLFLALSGLAIYSIVLFISFAALAIAIELSIGGMAIVGRINEHLPQEGARAALYRLLVAMTAPFVLVLAVIGVSIWIAMLPGGTYLLGEYALKGVTVGATQFNIVQILLIISAFYLTRTIVSMGTRFLARLPKQGTHFDTTLITPMQTFLTYFTWAIFGLFVLKALGMELSNLAMVAGGLSVGIGFGMQTIVNNFLSGLILIFGRTLQVGDVIEVGALTGRVRKISVRATMVETYDNAVIYVPNSEFMAGRLINWTSFSRSVRREVAVGVAYGSDTEKVIKLLIDVAAKHKNVLKYPEPSVLFVEFGSSTLDFRLRFWVRDYEQGTGTMSDVRLGINQAFNEAGIEIAYPQLDVHIKDRPDCQESMPATAAATSRPRKKTARAPQRPRLAPPAARQPQTS